MHPTHTEVSLYDTLQVSPHASEPVIRAAYRCLVQIEHPDKNWGCEGAGNRLAQINAGYAVLSDPAQRQIYDQKIALQARKHATERRGSGTARSASSKLADTGAQVSRPFVFRPLN
jgi:DnaJ-class molecular chaperone